MADNDWKIRREMARLELDIDNLESSVRTKVKNMRKRLQRIKEEYGARANKKD